jgi:hypothetical protein
MDRLSTDPYLDWMLILLGTVIITLGGIGLGYMTYIRVQERLSATPSATAKRVVFDQAVLVDTLKRFDARAGERSAIIRGDIPVPADPSI